MRTYDVFKALAELITDELVIGNSSYTSDEWHDVKPHEGNLYNVGLGQVTPLSLGLALALPNRRVVALDGDGGLLLNLGALTTVANNPASNLVVIVLDNQAYGSTGGQPTATAGVSDLAAIARGAGIKAVRVVESLDAFREAVGLAFQGGGPWVIVTKVSLEKQSVGPKPMDGRENKYRFARYVERTENVTILKPTAGRGGDRTVPPGGKDDHVEETFQGLRAAGFDFVAILPASQLDRLQKLIRGDESLIHVGVANEGEGAAVCAGAWLGGRMPALVLETSGTLVAAHALVYLHVTYGIPTLLLSTYRGDLGEQEWYAIYTGAVFQPLLQAMRIPSFVASSPEEIRPALLEARRWMDAALLPASVALAGRLTRQSL
jgi:sulfopyruvate decarboxylase TPP-binding subunit